jgi:exodeoxyribonuclease VII large subunit
MSESPSERPRVLTVSQLLAGLRQLLDDRVGRIWVVGEVSNLRRPGSGHVYFSLKDAGGQIRAALFRSAAQRLAFEPEDGLEVLAYGDVTVYEARGDLQIIVRQLEPRGQGALQLAFEQLRRRLEAEGLFDAERKRELPPLPGCVGIVTSRTAAALRDVLQVTGRRLASVPLLVAPTRVQGEGAEHEIAAALDALSEAPEVDLVLLVRGGGSLEDLQCFNSEVVARAIARCRVPVVSGVGHEVDVTIADLVADVRAPTPSAAAELALPDRGALERGLERDWRRLHRAIESFVAGRIAGLERERSALHALAPHAQLTARRARLSDAVHALERAGRARLSDSRDRLTGLAARMESLSPLAVLGRGYALVRRRSDGAILRSPDQVAPGDLLSLRVAGGEVAAAVVGPGFEES